MQTRRPIERFAPLVSTLWLLAVAVGMGILAEYAANAGSNGNPVAHWSVESKTSRPRLVMFLHPLCPCSDASVEELARLVTTCGEKISVTIQVYTPDPSNSDWLHSDLAASARRIPGTEVIADVGGKQAKTFGVGTSGHVLVYDVDGKLMFTGGITGSRGHAGDNAGSASIVKLVKQTRDSLPDRVSVTSTPVFGCPLFDDALQCARSN